MNKKELIAKVAAENGMTQVLAGVLVESVLVTIGGALATGNDVELHSFGKFSVTHLAARIGRNPKTGAEVEIPASKKVAFKAAKALKDAVQ